MATVRVRVLVVKMRDLLVLVLSVVEVGLKFQGGQRNFVLQDYV